MGARLSFTLTLGEGRIMQVELLDNGVESLDTGYVDVNDVVHMYIAI